MYGVCNTVQNIIRLQQQCRALLYPRVALFTIDDQAAVVQIHCSCSSCVREINVATVYSNVFARRQSREISRSQSTKLGVSPIVMLCAHPISIPIGGNTLNYRGAEANPHSTLFQCIVVVNDVVRSGHQKISRESTRGLVGDNCYLMSSLSDKRTSQTARQLPFVHCGRLKSSGDRRAVQ